MDELVQKNSSFSKSIRITHLCTFDKGGGAAKASRTLHAALRELGIDHRMLVARKVSKDPAVHGQATSRLSRIRNRVSWWVDISLIYHMFRPWECWALGISGDRNVIGHPWVEDADIVSLSWISTFLSIKNIGDLLSCGKPIIWTLYDMWAFSGGCHYSGGCTRYERNCGSCPQLWNADGWDLSAWVWGRKHRHWNLGNLTVVCPSHWLAECARNSSLLGSADIRVIPSGVDTTVFHPREKKTAQNIFGLPSHKPLILFIASQGLGNERKGGPLLENSLLQLLEKDLDAHPELVVLGGGRVNKELVSKFQVHIIQTWDEENLAMLYSACDVLVAPSKEDNLPLAVLEAMACGTPCVTFRIGGMPDVIQHKRNGYLAEPFDCSDLAEGIAWVLKDRYRLRQLREDARRTITEGFTARQEAERYLELFQEVSRHSNGERNQMERQ